MEPATNKTLDESSRPARTRMLAGLLVAAVALALAGAIAWGSSAGQSGQALLETVAPASSSAPGQSAQDSASGASAHSTAASATRSSQAGPSSLAEAQAGSSAAESSHLQEEGKGAGASFATSSHDGSSSQPGDGGETVVVQTTITEEAPAEAGASATARQSAGAQMQGNAAASVAPSPATLPNEGAAGGADAAEASQAPTTGDVDDGLVEVRVLFDSGNAHRANSAYPETLGDFTVRVQPGSSVYDALVETGVRHTLSGPSYIDSIGGIGERAIDGQGGWMFAVDGEFPMTPATAYQLQGGEVVRWAYTVVEGDV